MQVLGNARIAGIAADIAARGERQEIVDWACRVIRKHLRRTDDYLMEVPDETYLQMLIAEDKVGEASAQRILISYKGGEKFIMPAPDLVVTFVPHAMDTIDWVNSLPRRDRRIRRIERMSWLDAEAQSKAWHAALAKSRKKTTSLTSGIRKLADLAGRTTMVELTTKDALQAEGRSMGHCVGGYWARVAAGERRILSLRDGNGDPHVTIELSAPPIIHVRGRGDVHVPRVPRNGVEPLMVSDPHWNAVQVRGRQNKIPVDRWMKPVVEYLSATGMSWVELGVPRAGTADGFVHTFNGVHFADAVEAADYGERAILDEVSRGRSYRLYSHSGLKDIHDLIYRGHPKRVVAFCSSLLPYLVDRFRKLRTEDKSSSIMRALSESGLSAALDQLDRLDGTATLEHRRRILRLLVENENPAVESSKSFLIEVGDIRGIPVTSHRLPLSPLALLGSGMARGIEEDAISTLRAPLKSVLEAIRKAPGGFHIILGSDGSVLSSQDVRSAMIACGFAAEYAQATSSVDAGIRQERSRLLLDIKRARTTGRYDQGDLNRAINLLAEGYEQRCAAQVLDLLRMREVCMFGVTPPAAADRRPAAKSEAQIKLRRPILPGAAGVGMRLR